MSIFASRTIKVLELPADVEPELQENGQPHTVTIQALAGRHLERATQESMFAGVDVVKRMGVAFQKELQGLGDKKKQDELIEKAKKDPINQYDHYVLMRFGIQGWSYPASLKSESVISESGVAVDRISAIDDLKWDATQYLAEQILRITKPSLFRDADAEEAERKNAIAISTAV